VILEHGMREMLESQRDVFYYVTVGNENYAQPSLPDGVDADVIRGLYRLQSNEAAATGDAAAADGAAAADSAVDASAPRVQLLGSGSLLNEAVAAAAILARDYCIAADVWSVTSWSELARDGMAAERAARLQATAPVPFVRSRLETADGPVVAVSDYVRAVPESIRAWLPTGRRFVTLGTDGFGRSDTRAELRAFFEVDRHAIVLAAIHALHLDGRVGDEALQRARAASTAGADTAPPWQR